MIKTLLLMVQLAQWGLIKLFDAVSQQTVSALSVMGDKLLFVWWG